MKIDYSFKHIQKLTDKVGIIEHAHFTSPNLKEGYSVDDNARALLVCPAPVYLNFLLNAMDDKGFHQDMNADRTWKDDAGVHEGFGRAMIALANTPYFEKQAHLISTVKYPRVIAQIIIALSKRKSPELLNLADKLVALYEKHSDNLWKWYEDSLTYENARLPLAMFTAFTVTKNPKYLKIAKESLDFLITRSYDDIKDCFSFVGYQGRYPQQPVEAGGMVETCCLAYKVTGEKKYLDFAQKAFEWYDGRNILGLSLIDKESGGIKDGLEPYGINQNEGAESILSYILACQALQEICQKD